MSAVGLISWRSKRPDDVTSWRVIEAVRKSTRCRCIYILSIYWKLSICRLTFKEGNLAEEEAVDEGGAGDGGEGHGAEAAEESLWLGHGGALGGHQAAGN